MNNYDNTTFKETIFKRGLRKHKLILKQTGNIFYEIKYKGSEENNFTFNFSKELAFKEYQFLVDTIEKVYNNKEIDFILKAFKTDYSF